MKKTLLMTTALVAIISATDTSAKTIDSSYYTNMASLNVTEGTFTVDSNLEVIDTINVAEGAGLTVSNAEITTYAKETPTDDITINGTLTATNSLIEAGNDIDGLGNNSNILLDGATVTLTDSDLEANGNITIKDTNLTSKSTNPTSEDNWYGIWADGDISIEGGKVELENSYIDNLGNLTIKSGEHSFDNSEIHNSDISVSGGTITLKDNVDFTNDKTSQSFTLSDGKISMNGSDSVIGTNHGDGYYVTNGKFIMTGGTVEVNGNGTNYIEGGDITVSSGNIDIKQGATLQTIATLTENDNIGNKSTIKLIDDGVINLAGKLVSNINGNVEESQNGTLNILTSDAVVAGEVANVNINVDANNKLSNVFAENSYTTYLSSLNVNNGTFEIDKALEVSGDFNIANGAGVINSADGHDSVIYVNGNVNINGDYTATDSDITAQNELNVTNGQITLSNADLESYNTINISGGNLNMNDSSDLTAYNGLTITDGTINNNDGEIWSLGDINIEGGAINLTNFSSINTLPENSDDIFGETSAPSIAGNININGGSVTLENSIIESAGDINVNGGILTANKGFGVANEDINISAGTLTINGDDSNTIYAFDTFGGNVNISGGETNIDKAEINAWDGNATISDGKINLTGSNNTEASLYARKEFNMTGGTINMNGGNTVINNIADYKADEYDHYDLNISGGTINVNAGNGEISSSKTVNITGGTINIANNATLGIYGGNNKLETTANISDNAVVNINGTLDTNVSGNGNINMLSSTANITGNITGSNLSFDTNHSLNNAISGTIGNLASLNVNKGTLVYDKSASSINNLNVDGTLDIGTNTITATTANFNDNSKLALKIASQDTFGKLNANTINIGDTTTMNVTLNNGVVANGETAEFQVIEGSMNGDFTNKIADNSRYNIEWGKGSLKITGSATASDVVADAGGSEANSSTAEAWDSLISDTVNQIVQDISNKLNELSQNATSSEAQQEYLDALTALAPEVAPVIQQTASETVNQVIGAVGTRLSGGSVSASGKGTSVSGRPHSGMTRNHKGGQGMRSNHNAGRGGHRGKSSGDTTFEKAAVWLQGMFNKSELKDTSKSAGFDSETSGVAMGIEKQITSDTKVGIGYAYNQTEINGLNRTTDVDTHTAILYGEYKPSQWYINGVATYGISDYSENKNVAGINVGADYEAQTFGLQAMTGYEMMYNNLGITPEAGLRYVHIKQDSYKDTANQGVSSSDNDILTAVLGAKLYKTFNLENGAYITPEVRFATTYDIINDNPNSVVTLANGSAYSVKGEALDEFGFELGTSITAELNKQIELSLGYEGKFKKDYQDHSGLINVKYKF